MMAAPLGDVVRNALRNHTRLARQDGCDEITAIACLSPISDDGQGQRVMRVDTDSGTTTTTTYVYDAFGKLAAEYSSRAPTGTGGTFFRTTDHLGSTRLVTDASGNVCEERDFYPFGEKIGSGVGGRSGYAGSCGFSQQFTAKERDDESGLDYFGARYFGASLGRFTSPDPLLESADPSNPQTWNRYAYAINSPFVFVDPTGLQSEEALACAESSDCTLVLNVNVLFDTNSEQVARPVTAEQKKQFLDQFVPEFQERFGKANIEVNVTLGEGVNKSV